MDFGRRIDEWTQAHLGEMIADMAKLIKIRSTVGGAEPGAPYRMIVSGQRDIIEKAQKLVIAANNNGGKDNIAVILIEPFADEVAHDGGLND